VQPLRHALYGELRGAVRFSRAIDLYLLDMQAQGRISSDRTVKSYYDVLTAHADDAGRGQDPRVTAREDVKATLRRWRNPNTQRTRRAVLVSFYDWMVEEGYRPHNPARQTRAPRARKPSVYHMTYEETARFLMAAASQRERRVCFLGVCAGLRAAELRNLQGRHFARPGWVWVSADIAKGGHERWVPVLTDLEPVVVEIQEHLESQHYVIPAQQFADPGVNLRPTDQPEQRSDPKTLWRLARRVGKRAGIAAPTGPHVMRRAFADHIARWAGVEYAQILLGHADIATTQLYLGERSLDEVAGAVRNTSFFAPNIEPAGPGVETVGIEPTSASNQLHKRAPDGCLPSPTSLPPGPVDPTVLHAAGAHRPPHLTPNEED
jgi:integrase/recombinase XerD